MEDTKIALNAKEAAKLIGVSLPLMYEIMKDPTFPCLKVGRRNIIPKSGLVSWLNNKASGERRI